MLISCNRLKKYIKSPDDIDFKEIWNKFTVRVAEIEDVKEVGNTFDGVVVAEIKTCENHPNSDHLHILNVDIGESNLTQVVCGAPNVRVGLKTAFVKVGGHIGDMEITQRPLRGVDSFGMCCSGRELSISDNHEGILELPDNWPSGEDIKKLLPIDDIIVEIDNKSLTNRPDLWGHYGIAREVAALTNHQLLDLDIEEIPNNQKDLQITIKDSNLCRRYCGLTIDNITCNKTPLEDQIFLYYTGMRSISLLVDLTNILMIELGQPMHAFDKRVVKSIEVDTAKDGDTFTTLDGVTRKLTKDMLMIKNDQNYFGIAGVMGGLESEIMPDTTSVFLESANFDAGSIRKTAVALGLRTEASARYEKSLDPNMTSLALKRLVYLLRKENPNMEISSNLTDIYPNKLLGMQITLPKKLLTTYIGKTLEDNIVNNILTNLGFKVSTNDENYIVDVPTYRHSKDINIPEDIIEEIARTYGFENINAEPLKLDLVSKNLDSVFDEEYEVKKSLALKYNMSEVHSYLWYQTKLLNELNISKDGVKLLGKNEDNILRDDLCLSLLNITNENFKNVNKFNIFEIGTVIKNNENKRHLGIVFASTESELEKNYNLAKEVATYILGRKNKNVIIMENNECENYYDKTLSKVITVENEKIGTINVLSSGLTSKISKKKSLVLLEIDFDLFTLLNKEVIRIEEVSKYPEVELDYTIILPLNTKYENLKNVLKAFNSNLIKNYELLGIYENKYNIRYTLGSDSKTLDTKDLQSFKERFIKHIKDNNFQIIE